MLRLERRMLALGYFDGEPDEEYDAYTTQVVAAFEQACGLEATGVAGRTCVETLYSDQAPVAQRHVPHDIFLGDEGQAVREVQVILMETGMLAALPDGVYGSQMEEALDRLYDYLVAIDNPYAPLFATREMLSAQAQEKLAGEDLFAYFQDVDADAQSVEIERLQRRLHTLFYLSAGIIDGEYGQKTEEAVRAFQEKNGLEVTGVADEATQRMLFSAQAVGQWTKYRLDISISDQRVYVYGLNIFGEYELLDTFICSTGLETPRPRASSSTPSPARAGTTLRSSSAGRSTPSRFRATSCSTPCSTTSRTPARCATARCGRWDRRHPTAASACGWRTPSGSIKTANPARWW